MKSSPLKRFLAAFSLMVLAVLVPHTAFPQGCKATEPDMLGPFYEPNAPVRSSVGKGYVVAGIVMSSSDCSPIKEAKIEFWLVGPDGRYGDDYRATVYADKSGAYRFESHVPPPYYGRPSHIHILVTAKGFKTLVTQHYPAKGDTQGKFDLVLVPEK